MNHFLITRFNVRNKVWEKSNNRESVISEEWLDKRFNLFETYCLPSVLNQTNQNFYWCILFDPNTPNRFKEKIQTLTSSHKNTHIMYVEDFEKIETQLIAFINLQAPKNEAVITTRLDNDDLIHCNFIELTQQLSKKSLEHKTVISLKKGYQVIKSEDNKTDIRLFIKSFSPFISLVNHNKDRQTVLSKNHNEWAECKQVITYSKEPLWIQLVHTDNFSNSTQLKFKRVKKINSLEFGNPHLNLTNSNNFIELYNLSLLPIIAMSGLKSIVKYILRRKSK